MASSTPFHDATSDKTVCFQYTSVREAFSTTKVKTRPLIPKLQTNMDSSEKRMFTMYCDSIWVEYGPIVVGKLCDVVLALNLSKDVVHEGHTDAICSALSGQKFGHWFYQELA